eukprot:scaffold144_cov132-Isochrysis_galbana.AAC.3
MGRGAGLTVLRGHRRGRALGGGWGLGGRDSDKCRRGRAPRVEERLRGSGRTSAADARLGPTRRTPTLLRALVPTTHAEAPPSRTASHPQPPPPTGALRELLPNPPRAAWPQTPTPTHLVERHFGVTQASQRVDDGGVRDRLWRVEVGVQLGRGAGEVECGRAVGRVHRDLEHNLGALVQAVTGADAAAAAHAGRGGECAEHGSDRGLGVGLDVGHVRADGRERRLGDERTEQAQAHRVGSHLVVGVGVGRALRRERKEGVRCGLCVAGENLGCGAGPSASSAPQPCLLSLPAQSPTPSCRTPSPPNPAYLRLEVGHVVCQVPRLAQDLPDALLHEPALVHQLEAHDLRALLVERVREGRHGTRR